MIDFKKLAREFVTGGYVLFWRESKETAFEERLRDLARLVRREFKKECHVAISEVIPFLTLPEDGIAKNVKARTASEIDEKIDALPDDPTESVPKNPEYPKVMELVRPPPWSKEAWAPNEVRYHVIMEKPSRAQDVLAVSIAGIPRIGVGGCVRRSADPASERGTVWLVKCFFDHPLTEESVDTDPLKHRAEDLWKRNIGGTDASFIESLHAEFSKLVRECADVARIEGILVSDAGNEVYRQSREDARMAILLRFELHDPKPTWCEHYEVSSQTRWHSFVWEENGLEHAASLGEPPPFSPCCGTKRPDSIR